MLGRRNLRIKAMQILFGWEMNKEQTLQFLTGQLESQIDRSVSLYLTNLAYVVEVCNYSMVDKAKRLAKYIQGDEDKAASTTIAANRIVKHLSGSEAFAKLKAKDKTHLRIDQDVVKSLFNDLAAKAKYKDYAAKQSPTLAEDIDIIAYLLKKIFADSASYIHQLEEQFLNYHDDQMMQLHVTQKFAEAYTGNNDPFFVWQNGWEEERKFALDLLARTYQNDEAIVQHITPNLNNWDVNRIAVTDLALLKLAVCELLYFPTVPVKVSINEYIDISKLYSTPKSKDFVNGVLDNTRKQLLEANLIKKQGRGLVEN